MDSTRLIWRHRAMDCDYNTGGKLMREARHRIRCWAWLCALMAFALSGTAFGDEAALEHFEKNIRPLLAERCHTCHSTAAPSVFAGLYLDSRDGVLRGGDSGPAVVPGDSDNSLLLRAVRGEARVPMPPTGRLTEDQIEDLAAWVDAGSPWPREQARGQPDPSQDFDLESRRREHWSWQPVSPVSVPLVSDEDWPKSTVDRFILAGLEGKG